MIAKSLIKPRKLLARIFKRINLTGFSDIDYKPLAITAGVKNTITPNCGIIEKEGDLYLMTVSIIKPGEQLSANFDKSRYLCNKAEDKPNMDSPTLNSHNIQNYSELVMGANWYITKAM